MGPTSYISYGELDSSYHPIADAPFLPHSLTQADHDNYHCDFGSFGCRGSEIVGLESAIMRGLDMLVCRLGWGSMVACGFGWYFARLWGVGGVRVLMFVVVDAALKCLVCWFVLVHLVG